MFLPFFVGIFQSLYYYRKDLADVIDIFCEAFLAKSFDFGHLLLISIILGCPAPGFYGHILINNHPKLPKAFAGGDSRFAKELLGAFEIAADNFITDRVNHYCGFGRLLNNTGCRFLRWWTFGSYSGMFAHDSYKHGRHYPHNSEIALFIVTKSQYKNPHTN